MEQISKKTDIIKIIILFRIYKTILIRVFNTENIYSRKVAMRLAGNELIA